MVNVSTTQTLKESKEEGGTPTVPGPKGSPFEQFFDDFFDDEQKGGLRSQSEFARLRLRHRSVRSYRHQQSRHRRRRRDRHQLHQRHQAQGREGSRPRPQDRPRAAQGGAEGAAESRELRRFLQDARRRLGDGHRQSLRSRRQRHRRHHLRHQARHQCRSLRRFHPDRRRHQPRQFRRPALQHGRAGDRREHRHHLAVRRLDWHRLRCAHRTAPCR